MPWRVERGSNTMRTILLAIHLTLLGLGMFCNAAFAGGIPPSALGSRTLSPPPAPAVKTQPPAAAIRSQPPAASPLGQTDPGIAAGSKQTKYAPDRQRRLQSQITLQNAEDAAASSARKMAAAANATNIPVSVPAASPNASMRGLAASNAGFGPARPSLSTRTRANPADARLPDGIWSVNGKQSDFVMTPGAHLTISGRLFGDTQGEVFLFPLAKGARLQFQVVDWHDGEIYALLPAGVRDLPDQTAKLQVITRAGKTWLLDGRFYASREEIFLTTNLDQVIELHYSPNWTATITSGGDVERSDHGANAANKGECISPGTDQLYFKPLPNDFEVSGISVWFGRTDTGEGDIDGKPGNRVFYPRYALGNWTTGDLAVSRLHSMKVDVLPVNWGVWRSFSSDKVNFNTSGNECQSNYRINVNVVGPAGVAPF
jgi:hypothetical protein